MTNSTKLIGLIMTTALWAGVAVAQSPGSNWGDDAPPDLTLPLPSGMNSGPSSMMMLPGDAEGLPGPATGGFNVPQVDGYDLNAPCDYSEVGGLWGEVPPIESTGTWLQRGFWYADADAVIYNRLWNRDDILVAAQDTNVNQRGFPPELLNTNRAIFLKSSQPGEDTSVRVTLGHFLFRDSLNRDHKAEFSVYGGGNWAQVGSVTSNAAFGLFVPFAIDGGNPSFDNSSRQRIDYRSHFSSFEGNYRVQQRMARDQLIMDPNGGWHRAAHAGFEREYLIGLRGMQLDDDIAWRAEDIAVAGANGDYQVHTRNNLIGLQMGGGGSYETPRWSIGVLAKGGVYINEASGRSALDFTANDTNDFNYRMSENEFSWVGEFKLQGKYHVSPNASLRAAYELMYMTSLALAPPQTTFIPAYSTLSTAGDPFYHGVSFGIEGYW